LSEADRKREIKGLVEAMDYFHIKNGAILTYNQESEIEESGYKIKIIPVWKWILFG